MIWREYKERIVYPSIYWHTPSYAEMDYILNTRTNASNLRTLGRVDINGKGTYVNGCFLLPDDWVLLAGVTMTITTANYTTNSYSLTDFGKLESNGAVFFPVSGYRVDLTVNSLNDGNYFVAKGKTRFFFTSSNLTIGSLDVNYRGMSVRLCHPSSQPYSFSTSATSSIKFANGNVQYHCTQHKWRFAEHQYDYIGANNANLSDSYNGWIDLFGYGTSGVNYSPTLHTTNNADYASGYITNTDNDWGINEIIENDTLGMSEGIITAKEFKEI